MATWAHQTGLVGEDDGLDAVAHTKFHQDPGNVGLDCRLADDQFVGDLAVAQAGREESQDFQLAGSEVSELSGSLGQRMVRGEVGDQTAGDAGREERISVSDGADAGDELVLRCVFEQEAAGARSAS